MAEPDFEAPLLELQRRIEELEKWPGDPGKEREASRLRSELEARRQDIFANLTPWQKTRVARHPNRPYTLDYVGALLTGWTEVRGDRRHADDPAIVCGFGFFHDRPVCVVGHQKGRDTKEKIYRNFGMPKPEGYRKALRVMRIAAKFSRPILTFVDTPGAYPGIEAEERGQAEAIAYNLREMASLRTPIVVTVTGEGGSCASILFRDAGRAEEAATAMKITASDLARRELVDEVIPEPPGGAHVNHEELYRSVDEVLVRQLDELSRQSPEELLEGRYRKFRNMGRLGREFEDVPT
jgi:acetyl-CoA carboxylase carboxyl transferase subunit alpha